MALTIDTQTQPPKILLVRGRASVEIVEGIPSEYLDAKLIDFETTFPSAVQDLVTQRPG